MYQLAFVMEQALGHVTYGENLKRQVLQDPGVKSYWLPIHFPITERSARIPVYRSNWTVRAGWRTRQAVASLTQRVRPDVFFFHTQVTSVLALDWVCCYPSVISMDATPLQFDSLGDLYNHQRASEMVERLKWGAHFLLFRSARALVTWSEWARRSLIADYRVPAEKITVIRPGVEVEQWKPAAKRSDSSGNGPVRILFVGGDLLRKGGAVLLEAFRALRQRMARVGREGDLELHLVTKTPVKPEPGLFIYPDLGPNDPRLINLYHRADLFALPTFGDCLAVVLLEAAAAGLPVISTRVAAIPEIVREGETGLLVPPGDLPALTEALAQLAADRLLRQQMGDQALALAQEEFAVSVTTRRLLSLLKQVADSGKGGGHG